MAMLLPMLRLLPALTPMLSGALQQTVPRVAVAALAGALLQLPPLQAQAPQAPEAQTPHFSTHAEFVRVDTLVTNRGTSISGLQAQDFELRDNGVLQQVTVTDAASLPVDVAMALDVSDSMRGMPLVNVKRAATALVDSLRPGDRVSLVAFNDLLMIQSPLTKDFAHVRAAIGQIAAAGFTSLRDAAYAALLQSDPDAGRALVMVFTDGQDMSSWLTDAALIDSARRLNAVVYSITLGPAKHAIDVPQDRILDQLPDLTGGRRFSAERPERLREVFAAIVTEFRQRYVLSYVPKGVDGAGYHTLDVRLANRRKGDVRARPGYFRSK